VEIVILHNNNEDAQNSGYSPGDTLTEVYRLKTDEFDIFDAGQEVAIYEWFCLTADRQTWPRHPCSLDYLARGNRSLRTGDVIELDIEARKLHLDVTEEELRRRKAEWKPREAQYERGYVRLYQQHVTQADKGCDLDFLEGNAKTPEPAIY
jgi:hypothetical protein